MPWLSVGEGAVVVRTTGAAEGTTGAAEGATGAAEGTATGAFVDKPQMP